MTTSGGGYAALSSSAVFLEERKLGAKPDDSASLAQFDCVDSEKRERSSFSSLLYSRTTNVMKIGSAINPEAFVHLPTELLQQIFVFLKDGTDSQRSFWACCLVSRQWYLAAVPLLYERPCLQGRNFEGFSYSVCPAASIRRSRPAAMREFALYIKHLDMSSLAYESSNSLTARLLGRVKGGLESFVAPARSFS